MGEMNRKVYNLSVHEFVERIHVGGDLVASGSSPTRMREGTLAHQKRQIEAKLQSEVPISHQVDGKLSSIAISGRIDGIEETMDGIIIEEIKSTYGDAAAMTAPLATHLSQAKCYSSIYCIQNDIKDISVRIAYIQLPDGKVKLFTEHYEASELINWFDACCARILHDIDHHIEHIHNRNASIQALQFPYEDFRNGQRNMAARVYLSVRDATKAFIQAPTGIGKTMGTLFPALKALGEDHGERIFYLTARTPVKTIAEDALATLRNHGLKARSVTLTAKDKCCPHPEIPCHPAYCSRAAGYFDRLGQALEVADKPTHYGREEIMDLADLYHLCPYELSLDLSLLCDVIICDYNYAFDPRAMLRRFFEDSGDHVLLIDEAHNLVDRARDMFSAEITKESIMALKRLLPKKTEDKAIKKLKSAVNKLNQLMIDVGKDLKEDNVRELSYDHPPKELYKAARAFIGKAEPFVDLRRREDWATALFDLFFACRTYMGVHEGFDEQCRCYAQLSYHDIKVKIFCIDPSTRLEHCYEKVRSAVFFSASLTPFDYFTRLLCDDPIHDVVALPSPFPEEHLRIMVHSKLSTKYRDREQTLSSLICSIDAFTSQRAGNYLIFFPSYAYMECAHELFIVKHPDVYAPMQERRMSEADRTAFLQLFEEDHEKRMVTFAVMGGIFSEGIDLVGNRLIGAVIVGVGLPQICYERNLIKAFHDDIHEPGFAYAYSYPGFNRVLQAVGRVIRTAEDRGTALLIDPRFNYAGYQELMPSWWHPYKAVHSTEDILNCTIDFWNKED